MNRLFWVPGLALVAVAVAGCSGSDNQAGPCASCVGGCCVNGACFPVGSACPLLTGGAGRCQAGQCVAATTGSCTGCYSPSCCDNGSCKQQGQACSTGGVCSAGRCSTSTSSCPSCFSPSCCENGACRPAGTSCSSGGTCTNGTCSATSGCASCVTPNCCDSGVCKQQGQACSNGQLCARGACGTTGSCTGCVTPNCCDNGVCKQQGLACSNGQLCTNGACGAPGSCVGCSAPSCCDSGTCRGPGQPCSNGGTCNPSGSCVLGPCGACAAPNCCDGTICRTAGAPCNSGTCQNGTCVAGPDPPPAFVNARISKSCSPSVYTIEISASTTCADLAWFFQINVGDASGLPPAGGRTYTVIPQAMVLPTDGLAEAVYDTGGTVAASQTGSLTVGPTSGGQITGNLLITFSDGQQRKASFRGEICTFDYSNCF